MIIINGKVFRNLEEQVAYLSEMIPLFETDDGKLIIKQGDGTEIAEITLDAVSNMNVSTANDITTITITNADSTTQTFTIDMTGYLKKVSTQTQVMQAYIKQTDGSQQMVFVHWDNIRDTIPIRDQTGNIRVASVPTTGTHATSKNYVDNAIAGVSPSPRYKHFISAIMEDGCSDSFHYFLTFESSSDTQLTTNAEFKALFDLVVSGYTDHKIVNKICSQYLLRNGYSEPALLPCAMVYDSVNDSFNDYLAYNTASLISSSLTLVSITDTVSSL